MPNSPIGQSALVLLRQRVGAAAQQADVGTDSHKGVAPADVAAHLVLVAGEDAGRLADTLETAGAVLQGFLHLRMSRIPDMAQRGGEVRWADEDTVDALDGGDRLKLGHGAAGLDLDEETNL